jgi:hypothetical protein
MLRTVPRIWYFWNCSENVVFLELYKECIILEMFQEYDIFGAVAKCVIFGTA